MKIKSVKIKNFRSYQNETKIDFSDFIVFIGKNDSGKSTVLEALDIFFNEGAGVVKFDRKDISIGLGEGECAEISVEFTDLPNRIIIDETYQTDFRSEYLLNDSGCLEIVKTFSPGSKKAKVYINARHPDGKEFGDLLSKKQAELASLVKKYGLNCDTKANAPMRKAIWEHFNADQYLQLKRIEVAREDGKAIYEKLSPVLPVYTLFRADRSNSDGDNEVQDPIKEAVKEVINEPDIQDLLNQIATKVTSRIADVVDGTLSKLRELNPEIAKSLVPVLPETSSLKWAEVFKAVSIDGDSDIPINKRGSGVRRLVLLSFFRAQVERRMIEANSSIIYAIEEPETAQHAENQIKLLRSFRALSQTPNTQVILTTHSSDIVNQLLDNEIRIVTWGGSGCSADKKIHTFQSVDLPIRTYYAICYKYLDYASEAYHDELYSYILAKKLRDKLNGFGLVHYIRMYGSGKLKVQHIPLSDYIRHQIHHPENDKNPRFTEKQLRTSLDKMIQVIAESDIHPEV